MAMMPVMPMMQMMPVMPGLLDAGALPLPLAVACFEAKVDSLLEHCRWLLVMVPDAPARLDALYADWGRALLGAPGWHSATLTFGELGWRISGYARVVRAAGTSHPRPDATW